MWAYYEGFDGAYEIDGNVDAYRLLKFAMAILSVDPDKIIYLPIRNNELGNASWGATYDAVLCRPELQLRRSEWVRLRRQLDQQHRVENYVLRYEPKKLCDAWTKVTSPQRKNRFRNDGKLEINALQDDTVFLVLLKETCLLYHARIVELMAGGVPEYPSVPASELGWILSPRILREMESNRH